MLIRILIITDINALKNSDKYKIIRPIVYIYNKIYLLYIEKHNIHIN